MNADMGVREAYKVMHEASGIKKGDRVKVLRKAKDKEMGWSVGWISSMNVTVGKTGVVEDTEVEQVRVRFEHENDYWNYPFFVLEVMESAKVIRRVVTFVDETGKDVTGEISDETKRNLGEK